MTGTLGWYWLGTDPVDQGINPGLSNSGLKDKPDPLSRATWMAGLWPMQQLAQGYTAAPGHRMLKYSP